jgi:methionyl-tRNA formyltransferase
MIELAKYCCLNFHNSDLPKYKGRAAPIWAVINNEPQIAMTLHLIRAKEAIDSGLIIDKEFVKINKKDDMKRIYQKLNLAQLKILRRKLPELIKKRKFLNIKNISHDFVYSWNDTKDRELDLEEMTPLKITNTIRALKFPFSGAYLKNNKKLIISSCDPLNIKLDENLPNGVILSLGEYDVIVKVFKGAIKIKDVIFQGRNILPSHYCLIKNLKKYDLFN